MADYKTPGVYVEEISKSTPSAAQVATAIPIFIGYTERASKSGTDIKNMPTYISSLLEFNEYFGQGYKPATIEVVLNENKNVDSVKFDKQYYLYDSVRMFYANGGGQCCILSVGNYSEKISFEKISSGIKISKKENLPTLILLPDAMLLESKDEAYSLQQEALLLCLKLKDRFTVLDVYQGYKNLDDMVDVIEQFRSGIGINALQFGAAYYPWIQTLYKAEVSYKNVVFTDPKGKKINLEDIVPNPQPVLNFNSAIADFKAVKQFVEAQAGLETKLNQFDKKQANTKAEVAHKIGILKAAGMELYQLRDNTLTNPVVKSELQQKTNSNSVFAALVRGLYALDLAVKGGAINPKSEFSDLNLAATQAEAEVAEIKEEPAQVEAARKVLDTLIQNFKKFMSSLVLDAAEIEDQLDKAVYENVALYKVAVSKIYQEASKLPPSGAIAGIYSQVDDNRGVWKAPANVSLSNTVKPWVEIDNDQQENLNVDPVGGKSINAIRAFPGQGNLVWGGRTLAGNDSEWRYVSVRRFFNMAEKTLKQASGWAVFEPNTEMTWIRIRAMMNNFLINLWKAGAMMGSTPDEAFFVNVGLGTTMTQEDILEGRLIIEVGMAVVRPAEFVIIKFSHKSISGSNE
ncbi:MAG TPA: phage tail protein [Bacteroidales bacterium]|nr:phage tail protein [Bacteroidales bacterium]